MTDPDSGTADRRAWFLVICWFVALDGAVLQVRGALVPTFESAFASRRRGWD